MNTSGAGAGAVVTAMSAMRLLMTQQNFNQTTPNLQWAISNLDVGVTYTRILQYQVIVNSLP